MRRKYPLLLLELEITHRDAELRAHKKAATKAYLEHILEHIKKFSLEKSIVET